MKKILLGLLALLMLISSFMGCSSNTEENATQYNDVAVSQSNRVQMTSEVASIDTDIFQEDIEADYNESTATAITLDDDKTSVDGSGASYKEGVVNIVNAGTYVLSGNLDGQVVVEATSVDDVQIVLDNVDIKNDDGAAICIEQANKVVVTLADGSTNTLEDSSSYSQPDMADAVIFSEDDLIINGLGTMNVKGNYKHGIKCSDDLRIVSGTINVSAVNDGIRGKDSVAILDGNITVDAGGDGITATNADDENKGWILVSGGTFNITAQNNGFQAETLLSVSGGQVNIEAKQDAYHCNYDILISGGTTIIDAGDDGMHADNNLQIDDGFVDVVSDYEGIEGSSVYITGGNLSIEAVDDGINAAGGSDSDMAAGDRFAMESGDNVIAISGGNIYVSIVGDEGDGLDSNGNIYMSAGNVAIDGGVSQRDAAIDINKGTFEYSGGTLMSVGSTAMLVIPTTVSQPVLTIIFDEYQKANETIMVTDSKGNEILAFTPKKTYPVAMLSSPEFEVGETYTVKVCSDELFTITFDTTTVTVDGNGNATTAEMTGGGRGGQDRRPNSPPDGGTGNRPGPAG